jgi:cytochrome c553
MHNKELRQAALGAILALGMPLASAAPTGADIVSQGNHKGATACATCHGNDGAGNEAAGFPRLAGLNADYLAKQLRDFKAGKRSNPIMNDVAGALSDEEIQTVAAYFSALHTPASQVSAEPQLQAEGEKLASRGNWAHDIPACFRCHGDQAQGGGPAMPALAGQHQSYLQTQLQAWQNDQRRNDPVGLMRAIAGRLSEAEIRAVSAYLASLTPPAAK